MAGAGYKSWVDGDILTAGDVNTYLMQQAVMVFADASARSTAITAPSEGMVTYLTGTDVIEYYDGAAWQPILDQDVIEAKGDLIVGTADDTVSRLAVGTNGYVLTADSGETTGLKWAAGGGGKLLQVVQATYSTDTTIASTSMTDTGLTATITPSLATSKVLVIVSQSGHVSRAIASVGWGAQLLRDASVIFEPKGDTAFASAGYTAAASMANYLTFGYLDSPNTTSATTYKVQARVSTTANSGELRVQFDSADSSILLLEIGA